MPSQKIVFCKSAFSNYSRESWCWT